MDLEDIMELQELHCMPQINIYNYQDSLDDYLTAAQYVEDYDLIMRIPSLQDAQLAGISSRCIDTRVNHTNLNQSTGTQPHDNSAEVCWDNASYNEQAAPQSSMKFVQYSPLDYSDANVKNPDDFAAARRIDGAAAGRLVYLQSTCANDHNHNYQQTATGREKDLQNYANDHNFDNPGAAAAEAGRLVCSGNDHDQNDQIHQLNYIAGLRAGETNYVKTSAARSQQRSQEDHYDDDDQLAGSISSEEERITCSSSSSMEKQQKKKKRTSGTIYSSSCKPLDNESDSKLKLHRGSHKKRAAPFISPPQYRRPIIIHTYSPKIIHTSRSKFMWLVQSLTGSAETRSRCLENPPLYDHLHHQTSSAASMEAQEDPNIFSAHHIAPTYHHDEPAPMQGANPMMQTASYHHDKYHASPSNSPLNSPAIIPDNPFSHINNVINTHCRSSNHSINQSCTSTSSPLMLTSPNLCSQAPSNPSLNHINYNELGSNTEQSSSSTSCSSTLREVSPRGPLCARECSDGAHAMPSFIAEGTAHANITPPAPNFESWPLINHHLLDNNMEGSVHSNNLTLQQAIHNFLTFNPNYLSNQKPSVNFL